MDVYIGTICAYALSYPPQNWMTCAGQIVSIQQNTALFSLLGTNYGGNGTTTFALPNLQGCAAMGQGSNGTSNYTIGEQGGVRNVTLDSSNLPAHAHQVTVKVAAFTAAGDATSPVSNFPAEPEVSGALGTNYKTSQNCNMGNSVVSLGPFTGGSNPIAIESPYLALTYCIAVQGPYPPRS